MDFLSPHPGEPVMLKDTRNCFTSTTLQAKLLALGVRRLAITGIQLEQCCETTARVAADLGYAVDFVIDATLTFPIASADTPGAGQALPIGLDGSEFLPGVHAVYTLGNPRRSCRGQWAASQKSFSCTIDRKNVATTRLVNISPRKSCGRPKLRNP